MANYIALICVIYDAAWWRMVLELQQQVAHLTPGCCT